MDGGRKTGDSLKQTRASTRQEERVEGIGQHLTREQPSVGPIWHAMLADPWTANGVFKNPANPGQPSREWPGAAGTEDAT